MAERLLVLDGELVDGASRERFAGKAPWDADASTREASARGRRRRAGGAAGSIMRGAGMAFGDACAPALGVPGFAALVFSSASRPSEASAESLPSSFAAS